MQAHDPLYTLSVATGQALQRQGATLTCVESCTGGWIAKAITDVPGCSAWFKGSLVTYSDAIKQQLAGVQATTLAQYSAVSEPVVRQMAIGARRLFDADYAIAVSGYAGPQGGTAQDPCGTVWFAIADRKDNPLTWREIFDGDRREVRWQASCAALRMLCERFLQKSA